MLCSNENQLTTSPNKKPFLFGLNIRSLRFHIDELRIHLQYSDPSVILLNETWPTENDPLKQFDIEGYQSIESKPRTLERTGKPYLLKAQHYAFNISDSTTIPLTVQNWQITSFVPDSTDLVVDSSNKCLAVRTVGMQRCPGFHRNVSFAK